MTLDFCKFKRTVYLTPLNSASVDNMNSEMSPDEQIHFNRHRSFKLESSYT